MRLLSRLSATFAMIWMGAGCAQATQTYALDLLPSLSLHSTQGQALSARQETANTAGSLSVERLEGGQRLVVLHLDRLPAPERFAPGLRSFVVWLKDPFGGDVKMGALHYDRVHHSGSLLATTALTTFTVSVTGERDDQTSAPSGVLLTERLVVTD